MMDMSLAQTLTSQPVTTKKAVTEQTVPLSKEAKMAGIQQKQMDSAYEFAHMVASEGKARNQPSERRIRVIG